MLFNIRDFLAVGMTPGQQLKAKPQQCSAAFRRKARANEKRQVKSVERFTLARRREHLESAEKSDADYPFSLGTSSNIFQVDFRAKGVSTDS